LNSLARIKYVHAFGVINAYFCFCPQDQRAFLVPWILTVLLTLLVDLTHTVYLLVLQTVRSAVFNSSSKFAKVIALWNLRPYRLAYVSEGLPA
jgi:hypothetical protein